MRPRLDEGPPSPPPFKPPGLFTFTPTSATKPPPQFYDHFPGINETLAQVFSSWLLPKNMSVTDIPTEIIPDTLVNLKNFTYALNNPKICDPDSEVYVLAIIHSSLDNFMARENIRSTWGTVKSHLGKQIRLTFFVGDIHTPDKFSQPEAKGAFVKKILNESKTYGDIISGSFLDTYRNLTYKHIMAYKWANSFCPQAKFVLKLDDDVFVDLFQLVKVLINETEKNGGKTMTNLQICGFPKVGHSIKREPSKWRVTLEEYPFIGYPEYCLGPAYLVTQDVIARIIQISQFLTRIFWIDDVFIGVLVQMSGLKPVRDLLGFTSGYHEFLPWLRNPALTQNPYVVSVVFRNEDMTELMKEYFEKIKKLNKRC